MIQYYLFSPGGNITALITAPVEPALRPRLAARLLAADKSVEQVGFVSPAAECDFILEMAGGELCVNAARCAALLHFQQTKKRDAQFRFPHIKTSFSARIEGNNVELNIPPETFSNAQQTEFGKLFDFSGIRLLVTERPFDPESFETVLAKNDHKDIPAFGWIHAIQPESGKIKIDPWIKVKSVESLINETACGSGSIAAGLAFLVDNAIFGDSPAEYNFKVEQPSGNVYQLRFLKGSNLRGISIQGPVKYLGIKNLEFKF